MECDTTSVAYKPLTFNEKNSKFDAKGVCITNVGDAETDTDVVTLLVLNKVVKELEDKISENALTDTRTGILISHLITSYNDNFHKLVDIKEDIKIFLDRQTDNILIGNTANTTNTNQETASVSIPLARITNNIADINTKLDARTKDISNLLSRIVVLETIGKQEIADLSKKISNILSSQATAGAVANPSSTTSVANADIIAQIKTMETTFQAALDKLRADAKAEIDSMDQFTQAVSDDYAGFTARRIEEIVNLVTSITGFLTRNMTKFALPDDIRYKKLDRFSKNLKKHDAYITELKALLKQMVDEKDWVQAIDVMSQKALGLYTNILLNLHPTFIDHIETSDKIENHANRLYALEGAIHTIMKKVPQDDLSASVILELAFKLQLDKDKHDLYYSGHEPQEYLRSANNGIYAESLKKYGFVVMQYIQLDLPVTIESLNQNEPIILELAGRVYEFPSTKMVRDSAVPTKWVSTIPTGIFEAVQYDSYAKIISFPSVNLKPDVKLTKNIDFQLTLYVALYGEALL